MPDDDVRVPIPSPPQFIIGKSTAHRDGKADVALLYFHFSNYLKGAHAELFDYVRLPSENNFSHSLGIARIKSTVREPTTQAFIEFMRTDRPA